MKLIITPKSSLIDMVFALLLIVSLKLHILEDLGSHIIWVLHSKDSVSPPVSHLPVPLTCKVVLIFELNVTFHLILDCLGLLSLLLWAPQHSIIFIQ